MRCNVVDVNTIKDNIVQGFNHPAVRNVGVGFLYSGAMTFVLTLSPSIALTSAVVGAAATVFGTLLNYALDQASKDKMIPYEQLVKAVILTGTNFLITKGATTVHQVFIYAVTCFILKGKDRNQEHPLFLSIMV